MTSKTLAVVLAAAVGALAAAETAAQSSSEGWQFNLAPYMVAAGMDGTVTANGIDAEVNVPFGTIVENLDMEYEDGSGNALFRHDVLTAGPQVGGAFRI